VRIQHHRRRVLLGNLVYNLTEDQVAWMIRSAAGILRESVMSGLLEVSRTEDTHHPGCVIFDEPRQQSTRDVSFVALLRRSAFAREYGQQVARANKEKIQWMFNCEKAREKLANSYAQLIPEPNDLSAAA
jgi:hypothetical protein